MYQICESKNSSIKKAEEDESFDTAAYEQLSH